MAKKKVPKKAKRRLVVFGPIAIFIIVYCAFTLVTTSIDLYKLTNEEKELTNQLNTLKTDASDLKTEITKLQKTEQEMSLEIEKLKGDTAEYSQK